MSKLSIQFHALPHEVFDLMGDAFKDNLITVTEVLDAPVRFRPWEADETSNRDNERRAFIFTLEPPKLNANSIDEFHEMNPGALFLEIGSITQNRLSESWLWAMTDNSHAMKRWRKIARELRNATLTGAIAVNPKNGATAPMKGHRFTAEARRSSIQGLEILPAAGNSLIKLIPTLNAEDRSEGTI